MNSTGKKIHAVAVVLVACMLVGADGCGLSSCKADTEPPPCSQVLVGMGGGSIDTGTGGTGDTGTGGGSSSGDDSPQMCMDGSELGTYIRCWGEGPTACAARCNAIGAYCVEYMTHPEKPSVGIGPLKQCMENLMSYTCTYCYPTTGEACTFICALKGCGFGRCTYTAGKGCE